ncbi:hypothetical protein VdG1_03414 [Verticillium dahliae VDG1]|nr:hypothetical protein VdG1_03414 [Verticillium dahliae VDG1]
MPNSPPPALLPPPEGIFRSFDDLLSSVQRVAKDQGYGVVKLRASNYRDGKPTRYDLVCDRGGVKYNSTAKKRNPSTRKIDRLSHDMTGSFMRIEQALDNMNKRLENLENRIGSYEPRFQNMEGRLQNIEARSGGMDLPDMNDVDARLLQGGVM